MYTRKDVVHVELVDRNLHVIDLKCTVLGNSRFSLVGVLRRECLVIEEQLSTEMVVVTGYMCQFSITIMKRSLTILAEFAGVLVLTSTPLLGTL